MSTITAFTQTEPLYNSLFQASLASYPPAFGSDKLSLLIGKSVASILADRSRAPHKLPPACSPPGTRQPTWLLADVLVWLASHREVTALTQLPQPRTAQTKNVERRGRPSKQKQVQAERLSISIKTLRAREKGSEA